MQAWLRTSQKIIHGEMQQITWRQAAMQLVCATSVALASFAEQKATESFGIRISFVPEVLLGLQDLGLLRLLRTSWSFHIFTSR